MIGDAFAALAAVYLSGGLLLLLAALVLALFGLSCYRLGRRDQARWYIEQAIEEAIEETALIPWQRDGGER